MVDNLVAVDSQDGKTVYFYASGVVAEVSKDSIAIHYPKPCDENAPSMFQRV